MRTARARLVVVLGLVAATGLGMASRPAPAPGDGRFPRPDRPVAPIITSAYSTEEVRDGRGEAARVMDRLGIRPGARVADIGAGDGYYTARLARRLGPGGVVYAQDVERRHLDRLEARLGREAIRGVTVVHGTPVDPKLPPASVDVAILAHVYHEIASPYEFLWRLRPALAPGGRVAIVDLDRAIAEHGTPPALLRCELAAVGYRQVDFAALAPADGYLAVFAPPDTLPRPEAIRPCRQ